VTATPGPRTALLARATAESTAIALHACFVQICLVRTPKWLNGSVELNLFANCPVTPMARNERRLACSAGDSTTAPGTANHIATGEGPKARSRRSRT